MLSVFEAKKLEYWLIVQIKMSRKEYDNLQNFNPEVFSEKKFRKFL